MVLSSCTSIWIKLSYQFLDWLKVVPWIVLWKNSFKLEVALKLWSRRAAQFYLVIYSSKMTIWHIFAILGTLQVCARSETLKLHRMDYFRKNETLFLKFEACIWSPE